MRTERVLACVALFAVSTARCAEPPVTARGTFEEERIHHVTTAMKWVEAEFPSYAIDRTALTEPSRAKLFGDRWRVSVSAVRKPESKPPSNDYETRYEKLFRLWPERMTVCVDVIVKNGRVQMSSISGGR